MDNFDEFEFKPITEGLGFHKKAAQIKRESTLATGLIGKTPPLAPGVLRTTPIATPAGIQPSRGPARAPITPKKNPGSNIQPNIDNKTTLTYQLPDVETIESEYSDTGDDDKSPVAVVIPAILFDSIVVIGLTSLFAFMVLLVAKVDPLAMIYMAGRDTMTIVAMGVLLFSVTELYMIVSRSFFGSTLGEWAFDTELGQRNQQGSALYPIQVVVRTLLNFITGFIFFPAVAALSGVDLACKISGLRLRRG
mgnify:CR=1 FL=1